MCEAMERYTREVKEEGIKQGKEEAEQMMLEIAIHDLMEQLKITKDKAMKLLKVIEDQNGLYKRYVN